MFEFISTGTASLIAQANGVVPDPTPFYEEGWFTFLLLIAAIVAGWYLAKTICNGIRLSEYSGRMTIVLVSLLIACLMIWSKWPPKFGVDLRGGINMVGSLNMDAWADDDDPNAIAPQAKDIIPALIQRVNPAGTKEIMIRALGTDKIEVTIPSVELQEADDIWNRLVKAGKLEFRIVADIKKDKPLIDRARELATAGSRERKVTEVDSDGNEVVLGVWTTLAREVVNNSIDDPDAIAPIKFLPSLSHLVRDKSSGRILEYADYTSAWLADPEKPGWKYRTLQV